MLEHPAYTDAFAAHGLPAPRSGGWQRVLDGYGGWVCHVEQWHYGHPAKKATWLYAVIDSPPPLVWSFTPDTAVTAYVSDGVPSKSRRAKALVSWCGNRVKSGERRPRLTTKQASATPPDFRDKLLEIARSARRGA